METTVVLETRHNSTSIGPAALVLCCALRTGIVGARRLGVPVAKAGKRSSLIASRRPRYLDVERAFVINSLFDTFVRMLSLRPVAEQVNHESQVIQWKALRLGYGADDRA